MGSKFDNLEIRTFLPSPEISIQNMSGDFQSLPLTQLFVIIGGKGRVDGPKQITALLLI